MSIMKQFKKTQRRQDRRRYAIRQRSDRPRLSVFRSNMHLYLQLIDDKLGCTIVQANSLEKDFNKALKGKEVATEVGKILAKRALEKGITKVVYDCGRYKYCPNNRIACAADGARAGGLDF